MVLHQPFPKVLQSLRSKVTPFDLVVFSLFGILILSFSLFFKRNVVLIPIRVKVTDSDILYATTQPQSWYADKFQVGDKEVDTLGRNISIITHIESYNVDFSRKSIFLDINVRATYDSKTQQYSFKGKPLVFGTPLRFSLKNVYFDSIVVKNPGDTTLPLRYPIILQTENKTIPNYLAQAIKKTEGKSTLSNQGEVWVRIDKVTLTPAKNVVQFINSDNITLRSNDDFSDVQMTITANAKNIGNTYYAYEDIPLKINSSLPINFPELTYFPQITQIIFPSQP